MSFFKINGGNKLSGEIVPQGAKNEALQILCAVLLTAEKVTINNLPNIIDVNLLIDLLKGLGVKVVENKNGSKTFQADDINLDFIASEEYRAKSAKIRGSVMLLGPLLSRFGGGYIPSPGGDKIGRRRMDTHFFGFEKLGAIFTYNNEEKSFHINAKNLKGNDMLLPEASVTGTANILMAATMAEGKTSIYNAACEPYLQQLSKMLNSMGAKIEGIGSNLLTIYGVNELGGCQHTILPDMIEIGSFLSMAAITNSNIRIKNVRYDQLGLLPQTFRKLGLNILLDGDDLVVPEHPSYEIQNFIDGSIMTLADAPWPGLSPDLLSVILVMCTQAKGNVLVHQKMFESRLFFVDNLIDMGAQIILCDPHRATVMGLNRGVPLKGIKMSSPDIRAGVSLLIAALSAEGTSEIHNIRQIDRGYQDIEARLQSIGADIQRIHE
ncbi:MAG: UDP-N-acetylglucosamine 1-carboxyvinyltransferase [Bacteroidetes bacterium MED-G17]|nr:MAG: UDP-N-acetylglucosamine 1-carboxyvinyltransferase [Bacteroidetes bacterium TMED39]PDH53641.1 MAG: UDP-N-acetylglucosamine 1-carboxyvinyltransferase [Bacteroidetes bacterium MED-G17]CAI8305677.1 MAG: UDP-N-acetylglucosamine 1-carboxyvinyltransferase [Bacteroidetes bacterium MED-G17]|tara:strand:+ start:356 stop:1666 length:1311 start_codon:yes stop_codon:yes gene_type:complete